MIDNAETSPDILESRFRSRRNQSNLNVELGLINRQTFSSGSVEANSGGGGGAVGGTGFLNTITGGTASEFCFLGDAEVSLFNSIRKQIEDITKEHYLVSFDQNDKRVPGEIDEIHSRVVYEYVIAGFADGEITKVLGKHRYKTPSGEYVPIENLFGLPVIGEDGNEIEVVHLEIVQAPEGVKVYTFTMKDGLDNYVVDGKRVKNRKPVDEELNP